MRGVDNFSQSKVFVVLFYYYFTSMLDIIGSVCEQPAA